MKPWEKYQQKEQAPWEKYTENSEGPWSKYAKDTNTPLEDESTLSQVIKGAMSPLQGEEQKFDEKTTEQARQMLKSKGFDADGWSDSAMTAAMSFADTLAFGQLSEVRSMISDVPEEVYEAALQLRQKEQPWSSAAGNIAGYLVPGLGTAKLASTAARIGIPAAQAITIGVDKAEEGKGAEGLARSVAEEALGAVVGFGLGKALTTAGKALKTNKSNKAIKNVLLDDGVDEIQADKLVAKINETRKHYDDTLKTIDDLNPEQAKEFETRILRGESIDNYKYKDLDDALDTYKDMVSKQETLVKEMVIPKEEIKLLDTAIEETTAKLKATPDAKLKKKLDRLEKRKKSVLEESANREKRAAWLGMKMMDAQYVGNMSDKRHGTSLMPEMNNVSREFNRGLWAAKGMKVEVQKLFDSLGVRTGDDFEKLYDAVEAGTAPKEVTDLIENMRTQVNDMYSGKVGTPKGEEVIAFRKNYVPHYMKKTPQVIGILRNRIKQATGKAAGDITAEDLTKIKADKELMDSLKYVSGFVGKKEKALNDIGLFNIVTSLNHSKAAKKVFDVSAGSVKERLLEKVPKLVRDRDIGRVLGAWIDSTTNDAVLRKPLRKIRATADSLERVDPTLSKYLHNYVNDVAGGSRGLAGYTREKMMEFSAKRFELAEAAKEAGKPRTAAFHEMLAEAPQTLQFMQAQLYPYYLGLRADAVVRNLTQPYLLTVPSIGGSPAYKAKLILKSLPQTLRGMASGNVGVDKGVIETLSKKGWLPPDPTPGQFDAVRQSIKRSGVIPAPLKKLNEKATNFAMWGYQQSDIANRVVTLGVGKTLAKDLFKGNKSALKHVQDLPPAYKRRVKDAMEAGDKDLVEDIITDHLMASTQFNYNRASLSEFGREAGAAFSMFSKWPTAIGADIYDGFDAAGYAGMKRKTALSKGSQKLLLKYMSPLLMLKAADYALYGEEGPSPRLKQIAGASLESAGPINSILSPVSDPGEAFTPPAFDALKELFSGDGIDNVMGLLPLAVYGKFYTEKVPAWLDDERGQKPTEFIKEKIGVE